MNENIEQVFDIYIRPKLYEHYGNAKVIKYYDGILEISLDGQCKNCPSAKFTVHDVIETELKKHIPEIVKVVLIEGVSDDLLDFAKKILNKEIHQD